MSKLGFQFPVPNSNGTPSSTYVDIGDAFVQKNIFNKAGLYSWGNNFAGQLGQSNTTSRSSPVQIGSLNNWIDISDNDNTTSYAIRADGTLWAWGADDRGQLGITPSGQNYRSSPTQVGTLANWKNVGSGEWCFFAVKSDGTLWTSGFNQTGQLGLGDEVSRSSPTQIGSSTDWVRASGRFSIFGTKTDGSLWAWGSNGGLLGLGDLNARSSPVQVGSDYNWRNVSAVSGNHVAAIKNNGTLWSWGLFVGFSGNNDGLFSASTPIQIGSDSDWQQVTAGIYSTLAIKNNGTLWAWGSNPYGALGLGNTINSSTPVQVGSLTNWKYVITCRYDSTAAIKTDGTLWVWGLNIDGCLGLGDTVHRSSPVQVGSLTGWTKAKFNTQGSTFDMLALRRF